MASVGQLSAFVTSSSKENLNVNAMKIVSAPDNNSKTSFKISDLGSKPIYELNKSWILDSGATVHVCNEKDRFLQFKTNSTDDCLWTGDAVIPILGYGEVELRVTSPNYPDGRVLRLVNVVYVPTLHTNVVSLRLLIAANIH